MMNLATKITLFLSLILVWISLNKPASTKVELLFMIIIPLIAYSVTNYLKIVPTRVVLKLSFIGYFFWLIKEIVKSTIDVIKIVWQPHMNLDETMEWLQTSQSNDLSIILYANSITLTPGTVTLDVKGDMLLVHALMKASIEDLKISEMETRIRKVLLLDNQDIKQI